MKKETEEYLRKEFRSGVNSECPQSYFDKWLNEDEYIESFKDDEDIELIIEALSKYQNENTTITGRLRVRP